MTLCKRCGADIVWALTFRGKSMPLDLEPREDGNVATWRDVSGKLRARVVTRDNPIEPFERPAMPHMATCPGVEPKPRPEPGQPTPIGAAKDARRRREFARRRGL